MLDFFLRMVSILLLPFLDYDEQIMQKLVSLAFTLVYLPAFFLFAVTSSKLVRPYLYDSRITVEKTLRSDRVDLVDLGSGCSHIELSVVKIGSAWRYFAAHLTYFDNVLRFRCVSRINPSVTDIQAYVGKAGRIDAPTQDKIDIADLSIKDAKLLQLLLAPNWKGRDGRPAGVRLHLSGLQAERKIVDPYGIQRLTLTFQGHTAELSEQEMIELQRKLTSAMEPSE